MFRTSGRCLSRALSGLHHTAGRFPALSSTAAPTSQTQQAQQPHPIPGTDDSESHQLPRPLQKPPGAQIKTHFSRTKKPSRPPLVRNFFAGQVDTELLTFPEVINREDMQNLDKDVRQVVDYWQANVDSAGIVASGNIPGSVISDLRTMQQFGVDVTGDFGGRNQGTTETTRLNEAEAQDVNVAVTLNAHRQAVRVISECGSDEQKRRYLPRLASGELIGTIAFYEAETPDKDIFSTKAKMVDETWVLKGEKSCVVNAENANLFVIFAQTVTPDKCGDLTDTLTVFLIERSVSGFRVLGRERTIGADGVPQSTVLLDNVVVSGDQVVSGLDSGTQVAQKLLRHARLQTGVVSLVLMKQIIGQLTKYCTDTSQFGAKLSEAESLKDRLADAFCSVYALESMIYLTAGTMDTYEDADVDVETAIIRIFAQQNLLSLGTLALNFMGPKSVVAGQPIERQLRDALQLYTSGESNDSLLMFVGLSGIQHAGASLHEEVKKVRNPLLNPSFIFKRLFETQNIETPKSTLNLNHFLHPSLDPAAQWLEHSILRLQTSTETLLTRYGAQSMDKQVEVRRLSDSAVLIYAAFATVARASRSYCIGLQHSDFEMVTANAFSLDAMQRVKQIAFEIRDGPYMSSDMNRQRIASQLFKSGGYFAMHPLLRNF